MAAPRQILVTGGNAGIGFALCKQLVRDYGCRVFMGSRSVEKGEAACKALIEEIPAAEKLLKVVQIDASSEESIARAAATVKELVSEPLYALVNNAGTGLGHGVPPEAVIDTNLYGVKRVSDAFAPLLNPTGGRVVNLGSALGTAYVQKLRNPADVQLLTSRDTTWQELDGYVQKTANPDFLQSTPFASYGLSKAAVHSYTMIFAKEHPGLVVSAVSPGFIETSMTSGMGAPQPPDQGTVAVRKCLFEDLKVSGGHYESDGSYDPVDRA